MTVQIEVCVDSVDGALAAERGGAQRLEVCTHLAAGGLTPSLGLVERVGSHSSLDVMVLIRPRAADFLYSEHEFSVMLDDIGQVKSLGVRGIVAGALTVDGRIDIERTRVLLERARPLEFTFHRAFDMARDPVEALDCLLDIGVHRLLTSGQEVDVEDGIPLIRALVIRAGSRLEIMPGGGIRETNIARILDGTGAREIHFSASKMRESGMSFRHPRCTMGGVDDFRFKTTDEERVRQFVERLRESDSGSGSG